MTAFQERLRELIGGPRRRKQFAEICGIPQSTMRDYDEGATPSSENMIKIARGGKVSVHWLATGEGPRDIQPEGTLASLGTEREQMRRALAGTREIEAGDEDAVALPRLSIEGSAGQGLIPSVEEVEDYLSVSRTYLREVGISPQHAHVLRLSGHSMFPTLQDKDLIIIDASQNTLRDEEVYAVVFGDTVLIKRLMPLWDGSIRIMSDNKSGNYPDSIVPAEKRRQLRIVGRVGGYLRYI